MLTPVRIPEYGQQYSRRRDAGARRQRLPAAPASGACSSHKET